MTSLCKWFRASNKDMLWIFLAFFSVSVAIVFATELDLFLTVEREFRTPLMAP